VQNVRLKLARAHEHQQAIAGLAAQLTYSDCHVTIEQDIAADQGWLVLRLPQCPPMLSVIVGDCLYNLRSALDHLVWLLVEANPSHKPTRKNMFPICGDPELFAKQIKRGRLDGVADAARTAIEGLQPYDGRDNPLKILDHLHNIDKHRMVLPRFDGHLG
jgi:hypothetical protein